MITKACLALGSLSLLLCVAPRTAPVDDPPRLPGQGLNNCEIDPRDDDHNEVQVYAKKDDANYAVQFEIWDRYSDALLMGDGNATKEIQIKTPYKDSSGTLHKNTASFSYSKGENAVYLTITNALGDTEKFDKLTPDGTYDPIGEYSGPTMEVVRRGVGDKRRVRISAQNYGITYSFTLSDA